MAVHALTELDDLEYGAVPSCSQPPRKSPRKVVRAMPTTIIINELDNQGIWSDQGIPDSVSLMFACNVTYLL